MRGAGILVASAAALAFAAAAPAPAGDPAPARLPFSDDVPPPPPLPEPLDRHLRGQMVEFDGERIRMRWDWASQEHLEDFEAFVPVRATTRGGFTWKKGRVAADGTGGIRLRLGMLSDLCVRTDAAMRDPHDLGVVLCAPQSSDESVLCLVQDRLFTRFDAAAGNTNMINKLGGIPAAAPGLVEFRYVDRRIEPRMEPGAQAQFEVVRKGAETQFTISPRGGEAVVLKGKDTDTPMTRFTPGLYTSGGAAEFGPLEIEGRIDPAWCTQHAVLPFVAGDLLHPGNRFKGTQRAAAETVERFAKQDPAAAADPRKLVAPEAVVAIVGDVKVPLVIRIRGAEALMARGADAGSAGERLAALLDAKDQPARTLAWQVLRPQLPWDFRYEVDLDPKARRDAAQLIAAYLRERADAEAQGKVFVEGYWYAPERADEIRGVWERAWELRTPRIRLRTDLPRNWADWYAKALEAEYAQLVRFVGKEPPDARLPLSVFVFKDARDYEEFCNAHGYEAKAQWGRFVDLDRNVSFTTFDRKDGLANAMAQMAKQFLRFATGRFWPVWYDEGRASYFGNSEYGTVSFDGTVLQIGLVGRQGSVKKIALAAQEGRLPGIADVVAKDPRNLPGDARRVWYAEAWALHHWLLDVAPEDARRRFAEWQGLMERLPTTPRDVDDVGLQHFLAYFARDLPELDRLFREWVAGL